MCADTLAKELALTSLLSVQIASGAGVGFRLIYRGQRIAETNRSDAQIVAVRAHDHLNLNRLLSQHLNLLSFLCQRKILSSLRHNHLMTESKNCGSSTI